MGALAAASCHALGATGAAHPMGAFSIAVRLEWGLLNGGNNY